MSNLQSAREAKGIGFEKAAEALGIGVSTLWRYECGKVQRFDLKVLTRMADLYGLSLDDLVGRQPPQGYCCRGGGNAGPA